MKPQIVPVGSGSIAITSEDFLDGFETGHFAHQLESPDVHLTDRHMTSLLMDQLEDVDHTELYNFGYVVGWIATLANKGQEVQA